MRACGAAGFGTHLGDAVRPHPSPAATPSPHGRGGTLHRPAADTARGYEELFGLLASRRGGGALKEHLAKTKQRRRSQAPRAAYQAPFLRASPIVGSSRSDPPGLKPHTATDRS